MKSMIFAILSFFVLTSTGCAGSKWWSGIGAGRTAGVDDLPAGSMPASRIGEVAPYKYRSYESWSGGSYVEKGEWVYIQEVYHLDGSITRKPVKVPYKYNGTFTKVIYYIASTTDDPAGWKAAGIVYGPKRPNFKK